VAALIVISPELHQAEALAARASELEFVPEGMGVFAALPLDPDLVRALRWLALSCGATALLGFHARASLGLLTLTALPLYSLSQRSGAVLHDMHLFWFSALLAVSPCADVWSLDAWGRGTRRPVREYRVPADFARALLGAIYFFPGVHKLLESGWRWALAPNVTAHMHAKWLQNAELPFLRIDRVPALCTAGGVFVILFELSFFALAFFPRTRLLALAAGLLFHAATELFLFIPFASLWACYVVLVPFGWWDRRAGRGRMTARGAADRARAIALPALTGALLLAAAIVQGLRGQMQAWPFACYPTFQWLQPNVLPELVMEAESPAGVRTAFTGRERAPRSQAEWGRVFRLSGAWGDAPDAAKLREHALLSARRAGVALEPGTRVDVYRADCETHPERWAAPPRRRALLTRWVVESSS
jgi:hypothetical protein